MNDKEDAPDDSATAPGALDTSLNVDAALLHSNLVVSGIVREALHEYETQISNGYKGEEEDASIKEATEMMALPAVLFNV